MDLLLHPELHALEHGAATSQYYILEQVFPDVDVTLCNSCEGMLMDSFHIASAQEVEDGWVEHKLWALEALLLDGDVVSTWQLVFACVCVGHVLSVLQLSIVVEGNLTMLLLDHDALVLTLTMVLLLVLVGGIWVPVDLGWVALVKQFLEERGQISTTDWDLCDGVWDCVTFIDGHGVGDTLSSVEDSTCGSSCGEEGQNCLVSHVQLWHFELFEPTRAWRK